MSNLRASVSFRASTLSRILTTDFGSRNLPSACAVADPWKRFRRTYLSAMTSASNSSVGSAGPSRAAFRTSSRSHTASVLPLFSEAASTSRSSSGVILVATVLVRNPGFSWALSAALEVV